MVADTDKYLLVQIDSTFCKVHRHAAGARKILGNQAIGASRGGHIHDSECAIELLSKVNLEGKTVLGDKAFSSSQIRDFIQAQKATVCIPDKVNSVIRHPFDRGLYKARNIVERFFLRIKNHRHIATRYDKLLSCFENFIFLAAVLIQI